MGNPTPEQVLTVRVPVSVVAALDEEAARRRAANPGLRVSHTDAHRAVLLGAPSGPVAGSCR
jgi:hypothetical protein